MRLPPIGGTGGPACPWARARSESRRPAVEPTRRTATMTSCLGVRGVASGTDDDLQAAGRGGRKNWGRMRSLWTEDHRTAAPARKRRTSHRTPRRRWTAGSWSRCERPAGGTRESGGSWRRSSGAGRTARAFLNRDRSRSPARVLGHPIGHARGARGLPLEAVVEAAQRPRVGPAEPPPAPGARVSEDDTTGRMVPAKPRPRFPVAGTCSVTPCRRVRPALAVRPPRPLRASVANLNAPSPTPYPEWRRRGPWPSLDYARGADFGGDTGATVWYKRSAHNVLATTEAPA